MLALLAKLVLVIPLHCSGLSSTSPPLQVSDGWDYFEHFCVSKGFQGLPGGSLCVGLPVHVGLGQLSDVSGMSTPPQELVALVCL